MNEAESGQQTQTKEDLEREKLRLEISELNRLWWQRPAYIAAVFPTLLALLTLAYGLGNGYFQAQFTKLENKRHDLERENAILEERKSKLLERVQEAETLLNKNPAATGGNNTNGGDTQMMLEQLKDQIQKVDDEKKAESVRERLQAFLEYLLQINTNSNSNSNKIDR